MEGIGSILDLQLQVQTLSIMKAVWLYLLAIADINAEVYTI